MRGVREKWETGAALCLSITRLIKDDPNIHTLDAARLIAEDLLPAEVFWYGEFMGFKSHLYLELKRLHAELSEALTPIVDLDTERPVGIAYAMFLHYRHSTEMKTGPKIND